MTNILVTGSNGQLGSEIRELSNENTYSFFFTHRETLDISDPKSNSNFKELNNINAIIN